MIGKESLLKIPSKIKKEDNDSQQERTNRHRTEIQVNLNEIILMKQHSHINQ